MPAGEVGSIEGRVLTRWRDWSDAASGTLGLRWRDYA